MDQYNSGKSMENKEDTLKINGNKKIILLLQKSVLLPLKIKKWQQRQQRQQNLLPIEKVRFQRFFEVGNKATIFYI